MNERLLKQLRRVAIEQDVAADLRWDALAAGTATPEEEAKLRELAERSPEARAAYEVFQPSDGATLDALAGDVLARLKERDGELPERSPSRAEVEESSQQPVSESPAALRTRKLRVGRSRASLIFALVIGVVMLGVLGLMVSDSRERSLAKIPNEGSAPPELPSPIVESPAPPLFDFEERKVAEFVQPSPRSGFTATPQPASRLVKVPGGRKGFVYLSVDPGDARVSVNGRDVPVSKGIVEIKGVIGNVYRVLVLKDGEYSDFDLTVTADGAVLSKVKRPPSTTSDEELGF